MAIDIYASDLYMLIGAGEERFEGPGRGRQEEELLFFHLAWFKHTEQWLCGRQVAGKSVRGIHGPNVAGLGSKARGIPLLGCWRLAQ